MVIQGSREKKEIETLFGAQKVCGKREINSVKYLRVRSGMAREHIRSGSEALWVI